MEHTYNWIDIHIVDNGWKSTIYPVVPGHEVIGKITRLGSDAGGSSSSLREGDIVGVGPQVWSCQQCPSCGDACDQICDKRVFTYSDAYIDGSITYGGYAK